MVINGEINELNNMEKHSYDAIVAAIENIPPCFSETKRNIKDKVDSYIRIQKGQVEQMSKIYNKYIELKSDPNHPENTLYLFKSGLFFIFIDRDAQIISPYLNLKLGQLNDSIVKCGFPINSLQKYLNLIKNTPFQVEIISFDTDKPMASNQYMYTENLKTIIDEILQINVDNLSISQAYDFLYDIQNKLNIIYKESFEGETKK